jgi:hypothetical protein
VRMLHRRSPKGRRRVENLLTRSEFPVQYFTTEIFFLQDSARILTECGSQAAFVLRFACFATRRT